MREKEKERERFTLINRTTKTIFL